MPNFWRVVNKVIAESDIILLILDARLVRGIDPTKLIVDTELSVSPKSKVFKKPDTVIIACSDRANKSKRRKLESMGVRLIATKTIKKVVDLKKVLKQIAKIGFTNILLEGGSILNASMLREKLVDRVMLFTSPKLMGDDGRGVIGALGIKEINKSISLKDVSTRKVGNDLLVEGYL